MSSAATLIDVDTIIKTVIAINGAQLVVVFAVGFKVVRVLSRFEMRLGMMWADYKHRFGITDGDA